MLYLETKSNRYELIKVQTETEQPIYKMSLVKAPQLKDDEYFTLSENLPLKSTEV